LDTGSLTVTLASGFTLLTPPLTTSRSPNRRRKHRSGAAFVLLVDVDSAPLILVGFFTIVLGTFSAPDQRGNGRRTTARHPSALGARPATALGKWRFAVRFPQRKLLTVRAQAYVTCSFSNSFFGMFEHQPNALGIFSPCVIVCHRYRFVATARITSSSRSPTLLRQRKLI
jgi:hypothetical protein